MRVLVCGSRDWTDKLAVEAALVPLEPDVVIHGAAKGADSLGRQVATEWGFRLEEYPAEWKKHGRGAGPIRNRQMLEEGKPDLVLAFWDGKSPGTRNMIGLAQAAGVPVRIIRG